MKILREHSLIQKGILTHKIPTSYLRVLLSQCLKSNYPQRLGAIVVHQNKIVGLGYNQVRRDGHFLDGIHAEEKALLNTIARNRKGSTLYVLRILKNGTQGMSKPCEFCMALIKRLKINQVWYSTKDGWERIVL